jgi:hypothetical protein
VDGVGCITLTSPLAAVSDEKFYLPLMPKLLSDHT